MVTIPSSCNNEYTGCCLPPASVRCSLVNKEENNAGKTDHDEGDERDREVAFRQHSLSFACCS